MVLSTNVSLRVDTFNSRLAAWEPLLEPWQASIKVQRSPRAYISARLRSKADSCDGFMSLDVPSPGQANAGRCRRRPHGDRPHRQHHAELDRVPNPAAHRLVHRPCVEEGLGGTGPDRAPCHRTRPMRGLTWPVCAAVLTACGGGDLGGASAAGQRSGARACGL